MRLVLLFIGVTGLACATFLFPLLAAAASRLFRRKHAASQERPVRSVDILVPAHNEESVLGETLASISASIISLKASGNPCRVRILVGADACRDRTEAIARSAGARVLHFSHASKWLTLRLLVANSRADWCVLTDAGAVWPRGFLASILRCAGEKTCVGVAPAYFAASPGLWERIHWTIERGLKRLETAAGGPISTHGAATAYRREALARAFRTLEARRWLNDDVVLPWTIRLQNPGCAIEYHDGSGPQDRLVDRGVRPGAPKYGRRRRMVRGNLQWLALLGPDAFRQNPPAALLGLRRAFRIFWAYWLLCLGLALLPLPLLLLLAAVGLLAPFRGLAHSGIASLLAPLYLLDTSTVSWR
jgi:cellulose synthase/poly-beta-1,6-N-acetylglucosamine synthase-like glycosyltransferase